MELNSFWNKSVKRMFPGASLDQLDNSRWSRVCPWFLRPVPNNCLWVSEDDTYQKTDASQFVRVHFSMVKSHHILLLLGPHLHLRTFQGILITFKCLPVDPISRSDMWSTKILSVEIRMMTTFIPPSAIVDQSTGTRSDKIVIVLIFGGKWPSAVK